MRRRRTPLDETRAEHIREESDLEAEIEAHVAHRVDDLMEEGLAEEEALARAWRELGDSERIKEESRKARDGARRLAARGSTLDAIWQDLAYTLRQLRRNPGFAVTALVTLALGVSGATTTVSVADAVVLEPLPFEDPDRVVFAEMVTPEGSGFSVAEPTFLDWQAQARSFDGMAAMWQRAATLRGPAEPRSVRLGIVTHGLLDVLGLEPALGRMFGADEDRGDAEAAVALLSYGAWQSEHGGDPSVIGSRLALDGSSFEIIGVMPEELGVLPGTPTVFVPMGPDPDMDRGESYLDVVARLADGATLESARQELAAVQRRLGDSYVGHQGWSATVLPSRSVLIGDETERAGWILLAGAGLILLMACVNVSNLLVVRAAVRGAEMGVRAALGAGRGRLVGQLFAESSLIALLGGGAGILTAYLALPVVRASAGGRVPRLDSATLDGTALVACLVSVVAATLVCGLAPLMQLRASALADSMGRGRRGSSDPGSRLRSLLVGAQVSITVVLLVGTGLLLRSFIELTSVDPGFEPEGTLAVRIEMPSPPYDWVERGEIFPRIRQAVESLPGVTVAGATAVDPFSGSNLANFVARADRMPDRAADFTPIAWRSVTPGFFEAMGMDLRAGRAFVESDDWGEETPIVIGESLARMLWGPDDPVGQTIVWGDPAGSRLLVIGVVENLRDVALAEAPMPIVYRSHRQIPWPTMFLVARVEGDPAPVAAGMRARIREAVPGVPVPEIRSLEDNLRSAVAEPRFNLQVLGSFAVVGLLLAVVGVYGLTAFDVRCRFREIGIRVSLGAVPDSIPTMILRRRMRPITLGIVIGLAGAWALVRGLESQLYGVTTGDPPTWTAAAGVVTLAVVAAIYMPSRRAARIDPTEVLRAE